MAGIYYGDSGTNRTIVQLIYGDAGVNRSIAEAWYQDGGTLRKIWPPAVVSLSNRTIDAVVGSPGTATAQYQLLSTGEAIGSVSPSGSGAGSYLPEWGQGLAGAGYDARFTITSGTLSTGTAGTWLNLGTTRSWTRSRSALGISAVTGTMEIRDAGTLVVLATATITLTAEVV